MTVDNLIYHYCSSETFLSLIKNNELWLAEVTKTNDSTEGQFYIDFVKRYVKDKFGKASWFPKEEELDFKEFYEFSKRIWVCCFSEDGNFLSQWRGYADDGKGFSVGFDKTVLDKFTGSFKNEKLIKHEWSRPLSLKKILYTEKERIDGLQSILMWLKMTKKKDSVFFYEFKQFMTIMAFMFKNESFKEECERRIICCMEKEEYNGIENFLHESHFKTRKLHFRQTSKGIVHYLKMKIPENAIKKVMLGPKNFSDIDDIELLLSENGFVDIKVEKTIIPYC